MSAAVRSLLIFFFGVLVGALAILLTVPSFSITVTSVPKVTTTPVAVLSAVVEKPVEKAAPAKVEVLEKSEPVKVAEEKAPTKTEEPVAKVEEPAKVPMTETKAPESKTEVVVKEEPAPVKEATKPAANQKLDFAALNSRPIFWPASVQVTTATSTPLLEKGQKVADIPLNVGSVLQISKVLGDGALEVRAQGLKFEIDSRLTDFDSAVRKRIAELADKGSTIPPPFVQPTSPNYVAPIAPPPGRITLPATATTPAPAGTPAATTTPAAPADTTTKPKPKDKLDDKMNSLFGRRVPAGTDTNGDK